jgi:N-acetylneuraminic acid mutarotase
MKVKRNGPFTATLLATGKVLIAGNMLYKGTGRGRYAIADTSAELYDPATGTFSAIANMPNAHGTSATATVLNNGKVLVLGGLYYTFYRTTPQCTGAADVYDPVTNTWSAAAPYTPICGHTATKLRDGRVLAAGGGPRNYQASEIYDPGPAAGP